MYFELYQIISITLLLIVILYKFLTRNHNYWHIQGIPTAKGLIPGFGNIYDVLFLRKSIIILLQEIYESYPGKSMVGLYNLETPVLLVKHPELVKQILQSDFASFSDHIPLDEKTNPLVSRKPFYLNDEEWRRSRRVFTTALTSKKLKFAVSILKKTSERLTDSINKKYDDNDYIEVNAKNIFGKFAAEVASEAIFGVQGNQLTEERSDGMWNVGHERFLEIMNKLFNISNYYAIKQNIYFLLPWLYKVIATNVIPNCVNNDFAKIVSDIRLNKNNNNNLDHFYLQHIECCFDYNERDNFNFSKSNDITALAFGFFTEMYEVPSIAMCSTAYLLAKHREVQEKARNEIMNVLKEYQEISYDSLNEMKYLDQVVKESLRFYSLGGHLQKICTNFVTLQGPDGLTCSLKPGDLVYISINGLHKDPEYWKDPNEFIPERFDANSEGCKHKFAHLPFGAGLRMCPGVRLALILVKTAMVVILKDFLIEQSSKMEEPIRIDPKCFLTPSPVNGFWIKLKHNKYTLNK